jgi:protein-S-isoprenylcysteine O-methyltransferase Ste14/uncharacterized membrane protein (UPF0127 family)
MPIINETRGKTSRLGVREARDFLGRCVGLLGTRKPERDRALHIVPCSAIHTFGMAYSIDVLFLDGRGRVIRSIAGLPRNRIVPAVAEAESVLELPTGAIRRHGLREGDRLRVVPDAAERTDWKDAAGALHGPVNLFLALLWSRFVLSAADAWRAGGNPLGLGILAHNTLLMLFFLTRRKSERISLRPADWAVPVLTLGAAMLLRPADESATGLGRAVSMWIQTAGMAAIVGSLLSLGRSFGVVPANRSVVSGGAYRLVRHPLYGSEMIFYAGFLAGNPTGRNVLLVLFILAGQMWRSGAEERVLSIDPAYRAYRKRVRFRFVPGVF